MSDQSSELLEFGLSALQAKVYVALVQLGTCRASVVSSRIGLVRPETYRVLGELSAKGLVRRNLGSPSSYTAAPPNTALRLLVEQHERKVKILNQRTPALVKLISSSRNTKADLPETLTLVSGQANLRLNEIQMISTAKDDFVAIVSKFHLMHLFEDGVARALISAKRRGVRVRVLAEIRSSNARFASRLARYVDVRRTHDLLFCMDVADRNEVVFGPASPNTEEEKSLGGLDFPPCVMTKNSRFVGAMYTIFERLWEASSDYAPQRNST